MPTTTESADRMDIETDSGETLRLARYGTGIVIGTTNGTTSTSTALTPNLARMLAAKIVDIVEQAGR